MRKGVLIKMEKMIRYGIYGVPVKKDNQIVYRDIVFVQVDMRKDKRVMHKINNRVEITKVYLPKHKIIYILRSTKFLMQEPVSKQTLINIYGNNSTMCNYIIGKMGFESQKGSILTDSKIIYGCRTHEEAIQKYIILRGTEQYNPVEYDCIRLGKNVHMNAIGLKNNNGNDYEVTKLIQIIAENQTVHREDK